MKISRVSLLAVLALLCTGLAFADGIQDPKIIIHGVSGGGAQAFGKCPGPSCTNVGFNFEFSVPEREKGHCFSRTRPEKTGLH